MREKKMLRYLKSYESDKTKSSAENCSKILPVKLSKIILPIFSGKWLILKDLFRACVHNDNNLSR